MGANVAGSVLAIVFACKPGQYSSVSQQRYHLWMAVCGAYVVALLLYGVMHQHVLSSACAGLVAPATTHP
jgi:hypothetical protein